MKEKTEDKSKKKLNIERLKRREKEKVSMEERSGIFKRDNAYKRNERFWLINFDNSDSSLQKIYLIFCLK